MKKKTPIKQSNNFLIILISSILIISLSLFLFKSNRDYITKDSADKTKTYINDKHNFQITFPADYEALTDKDSLSGWPNAIVLLYNGGQSYDLPIEIWDEELSYRRRYPSSHYDTKAFKTKDNKFITLTNFNYDPEVVKIMSTFKFRDSSNSSQKQYIPSDWKQITMLDGKILINYPPYVYLEKSDDSFVYSLPEKGANIMNSVGLKINAKLTQQNYNFELALSNARDYFKPYKNFSEDFLWNDVIRMSGELNGKKRIRAFKEYGNYIIEIDWNNEKWSISEESLNRIINSIEVRD